MKMTHGKGKKNFEVYTAEEFVAAYERQIAEFKRLGAGDEHLKETVILNESDLVTDPAITDAAVNDDSAVREDVAVSDDQPDSTIDLNESARLVLKELEELENSSIEQIDEDEDFKATVAFEALSLDDLPDELPDEEPDRAEG